MAIIKKDGLNFYDGVNSECIVVESEKIAEYVNYILLNEVKWVSLNNQYYTKKDIDFVIECPSIERLSITSSTITDYSSLQYMKHLKVLSIEDPKGKIDLSKNTAIEELSIEFNKNIVGINVLKNLKKLKLWKYNPASKDLVGLNALTLLEELCITQSNITSLVGCGNMKKLKRLELNYLPKLEYIDEIQKNADVLKSLKFDNCKKIKNHEYVSTLQILEVLAFDDCGEIPSIKFIYKMTNLRRFTFVNTNVLDGELSVCEKLEYVGFINKKHYSHKMDDFKK